MRYVLAATSTLIPLLLSAVASAASTTVVISEFRTRGPNGSPDEFIELYNMSNSAVSVEGWRVMASVPAGTTSQLFQFPAGATIAAHGFYLLANSGGYSGATTADATYTGGVQSNGGIGLLDAASTIVDAVGMNAGSAYREGTVLAQMTAAVNQSYERLVGGCNPSQDTDNNSADFRLNAATSYPQNSSTDCSCDGVTCTTPPNTQCYAASGTCSGGTCTYQPSAVGTACSDNDLCTVEDACSGSGVCQPGAAQVCNNPPAPICYDEQTLETYVNPGTCSATGGCEYIETTRQTCPFGCNGVTLACNPDPCTDVTCTTPPANGCYGSTGTCTNGTCGYPLNDVGTACTDSDACTTGEACDASGACVGGTAVAIDDGDPCTVDSCSATGGVSHTPAANDTDCDDGNPCNGVSTCQAGVCTAGTPVTCATPPPGGCYSSTGSCNATDGSCTYAPLAQSTTCNDGDACTDSDQCDGNGVCAGTTHSCADYRECVGETSRLHWSGSCSEGSCTYSEMTDTACTTGCDATSRVCNEELCVGVTCATPPDTCHESTGTCNAGVCTYALKAENAGCDDGNACTSIDQCSAAGACQGTPLLCNTPPNPACADANSSRHWDATGTCTAGDCTYTPTVVSCQFGCDSGTGLCMADPCASVTCDEPTSQCHQATGTCTDGQCSYELKPANSTCSDGNVCTDNDVCSAAGVCAGAPKVCNSPPAAACNENSSRVYAASGTCNTLGECVYQPTDTACSFGCNAATGMCQGDPCAEVSCNQPAGPCFADQGDCSNGQCTYAPKAAAVPCDDGDACTGQDACDGQGHCVGVASCGAGGAGGAGGADTGGTPNIAGSGSETGGTAPIAGASNVAGSVAETGGTEPIAGGSSMAGSNGLGGVVGVAGGTATTGGTTSAGGAAVAVGGSKATGGSTATGGTTAASGGSSGATATGGARSGGSAGQSAAQGGSSPASGGASTAKTGGKAGSGTGGSGKPASGSSDDDGGCGCSVPKSTSHAPWLVALLAVLGLRRRRRS